MLAYIVLQNRAFAAPPWYDRARAGKSAAARSTHASRGKDKSNRRPRRRS